MAAISQPSLFEPTPLELPPSIGSANVIAIDSLHLMCRGRGSTALFDFSLNPYRGCSFGCSYCYAPFFEPNEDKRAAWGTWVEVKKRALEAMAKENLEGKRIYMSTVTDPYQPLEAKTGLTRSIVQELLERGARLVIQTRSPIVERDIDLLRQFKSARVNLSLATDWEEMRRIYEPACASVERRLKTVERLKKAGLAVSVCICPMIPMDDPARFGQRLDDLGADRVTASWFHDSKRPFTSNTRKEALDLNKRFGWTEVGYMECRSILQASCRAFGHHAIAFAPV